MKNKYINLLLIFILLQVTAQSQNWVWSKQIGGTGLDGSATLCKDPNNNIYIAGGYHSNPCYTNGDTLYPNGASDFFIAKYDASGNEIWVKSLGGLNTIMQPEGINSIVYDSLTNTIFVIGSFCGTSNFDSFTLNSNGDFDAFIARMDTNGNFLWAKKIGGSIRDLGFALDIDGAGNIYAEFLLSSGGWIDTAFVSSGVYFVKYDYNGNRIWKVKKINTNASINVYDAYFSRIKVKNGNIFAIGQSFVQSLTIDTVSCTIQFLNGQSLIACLDTNGTAKWIKPCAGELNSARDLTLDNDCNIYFTGYFDQIAIFESDTLHSTVQDLFLVKYDSSGKKIWDIQIYSSSSAVGSGISYTGDEGIYLTGRLIGSASFGAFSVSSTTNGDMFLARYDTSGSCVGVRHLGQALGTGIIADNAGELYVSGVFYGTVAFVPNPSLISYGQSDIYIVKSDAITDIGGEARIKNNQLIIYANPNKGTCNVTVPDEFQHEKNLTLQIFDNAGKLLQQTKVEMQQDKIKVNLEEEAKGVYNVTLSSGKKSYNGKIVFE